MTANPDIFLSYNREDAVVAKLFADAFACEGLEVWWDQTLRSGEAYDEVTEAALRGAKVVVVLWSPRSVASRWVRAEATIGERNQALMPVTIEPCERPVMFELTQTADLAHWRGDADEIFCAASDSAGFRSVVVERSQRAANPSDVGICTPWRGDGGRCSHLRLALCPCLVALRQSSHWGVGSKNGLRLVAG